MRFATYVEGGEGLHEFREGRVCMRTATYVEGGEGLGGKKG